MGEKVAIDIASYLVASFIAVTCAWAKRGKAISVITVNRIAPVVIFHHNSCFY